MVLGGVEDVVSSNMAQQLPLIGSKLADAATFLHDMRTGLLADLRKRLSGNGKAIEYLRDGIWQVFGPS